MMFDLSIVWNPRPEIFTLPGINWPIRWYGLMWATAFIASHFVLNKVFKSEGRTNKQLDTLTLYIILGTVIGARLGHCLFYGPQFDSFDANGNIIQEGYISHPLNILKVYEGGLASHGGAIGIIVGMLLYCRKTKESWLWLFDKMVIAVPLASFFIRLGNLINGEIVGNKTNLPWGFIFKNNQEDVDNFIQFGIEIPARHPTQLYEATFYLLFFFVMYGLWKNKRNNFGAGFMFGLLCVVVFTQRFLVEFLKENQEAFENKLPINMGQILSIPFVCVGLFFIWKSYKLKKSERKLDSLANHSEL
jgi:phosphatidylglycerol:prolipoprotein diacylglycerol transferase